MRDSLLFTRKPKECLKGAAVSHVSKNTHIYNSEQKKKKRSRVWCGDGSAALSKCLFSPVGRQQPQFPFFFFFLNLLVWLLQARQSSTFYEPHSSNGASLPLPTHNIPRTSRKQFYYSYYYIYIFYDQTTFFLLMGDLFYLQ